MGTRERIIQAASELFQLHGFHAVGLDQVLARVGVTKTTFYNHFESKDHLVIAVLHENDRQDSEDWLEQMRQRGAGDPRAEILALFDIVEAWLSDPGFQGCMFLKAASEYPSPNDPVHQAALEHSRRWHAEIAARARRAGVRAPDALATQLMLVLTGAVATRQSSPGPDRTRAAHAAACALLAAAAT